MPELLFSHYFRGGPVQCYQLELQARVGADNAAALIAGAILEPHTGRLHPRTAWTELPARRQYVFLGLGGLCGVRWSDSVLYVNHYEGRCSYTHTWRFKGMRRGNLDDALHDLATEHANGPLRRWHLAYEARTLSGLPWEIIMIRDMSAQKAAAEAYIEQTYPLR